MQGAKRDLSFGQSFSSIVAIVCRLGRPSQHFTGVEPQSQISNFDYWNFEKSASQNCSVVYWWSLWRLLSPGHNVNSFDTSHGANKLVLAENIRTTFWKSAFFSIFYFQIYFLNIYFEASEWSEVKITSIFVISALENPRKPVFTEIRRIFFSGGCISVDVEIFGVFPDIFALASPLPSSRATFCPSLCTTTTDVSPLQIARALPQVLASYSK